MSHYVHMVGALVLDRGPRMPPYPHTISKFTLLQHTILALFNGDSRTRTLVLQHSICLG
jgi:hypothetical protein